MLPPESSQFNAKRVHNSTHCSRDDYPAPITAHTPYQLDGTPDQVPGYGMGETGPVKPDSNQTPLSPKLVMPALIQHPIQFPVIRASAPECVKVFETAV